MDIANLSKKAKRILRKELKMSKINKWLDAAQAWLGRQPTIVQIGMIFVIGFIVISVFIAASS